MPLYQSNEDWVQEQHEYLRWVLRDPLSTLGQQDAALYNIRSLRRICLHKDWNPTWTRGGRIPCRHCGYNGDDE